MLLYFSHAAYQYEAGKFEVNGEIKTDFDTKGYVLVR